MKRYIALLLIAISLITILLMAGCKSSGVEVRCVDDLEGSRIGVQLGTTGDTYVSDYEGDEAGTVVERYNKGNDAIQALLQKKLDAVVIDLEPATAFVETNPQLMILEEEFENEDYAICIGKDKPELKAKINDALAKITEDGTLDKIKRNYVGEEDEKGKYPYEKKNVERPNGTLVVATNAEFPPYEYHDNGIITGFDMDMMQAVCDVLGMELKIEDMKFDTIINAVQSGKADVGASGMTITEDRLKNIDFTDSYINAKQVIIVKDPNKEADNLSFIERVKQNFVEDGRWTYLVQGLITTFIISIIAALMGIIIGFVVAIIRSSHDKNGGLKVANFICHVYLTVIRGTPAVVQLLIIYYVIFSSVNVNKIVAAVIAFGINSGAYVAEIIRSGIASIDSGQFEAGRSLGLTFPKTMRFIILPQAIKNVLPALANEFIVLIKETSISGYIGLADLTRGGDIIRSITYEPFLPLVAVALIYLVIVVGLTKGVSVLERRLNNGRK
ncbi:MAG: transporter substrate-binding domain-containing protein [Lachnospiraceae bacterium]|nr:transporter substrate-binding domain-containing protein [Lachnospiraceae bacterium]